MNAYLETLQSELLQHANSINAARQQAYMRHKFSFLGIPAAELRALVRPFLTKNARPAKLELSTVIQTLWQQPEREYQYVAQQLAFEYINEMEESEIAEYEWLVVHKSWWDTVDFVATKLIGAFFQTFPDDRHPILNSWIVSENLWLRRSALLFQLKYKRHTDAALLSSVIRSQLGSKEFFINKAIGWSLREYAKTNPEWVLHFVRVTPLSGLSRREALKNL